MKKMKKRKTISRRSTYFVFFRCFDFRCFLLGCVDVNMLTVSLVHNQFSCVYTGFW